MTDVLNVKLAPFMTAFSDFICTFAANFCKGPPGVMRVSVIIPVYNVSDYVERCVRSVMDQTYRDIECVIVDDCSPDDSITKCERMIEAYEGPISFSIVRHEKNKGVSAARNTGLKASTGDYVAYMDSDDAITEDFIEKLARPIKRDSSIEMVIGNFVRDATEERVLFTGGHPGFLLLPEGLFRNAL